MTREECETIVRKDAGSLYLGNLNTVEFDISLPAKGTFGSDITWESGNTKFLHNDGRVTQPEYGRGNRNVPLCATFRCGSAEIKKTYTVHILEEKNKIQIKKVHSIRLRKQRDAVFFLPSVAIVETAEHDVIAHPVTWEGGTARSYPSCGEYKSDGVIAGTEIPVAAQIDIVERASEAVKDNTRLAEPFSSGEVGLEPDGAFWNAQCRNLEFLLSVNDDQMLYNFRFAAGLDTKGAPEMIGWDAPDSLLRGHTTGHYLSALGLCYEATGDSRIRQKAEYVLGALWKCQETFSHTAGFHEGFLSGYSEEQFDLLEKYVRYPEIWAPYYTLHKILAGLLECRRAFDSALALAIAEDLGDWVYARLSRLPHDTLTTMWGLYIAGEFGGMNDVMAQLYLLTGKRQYLDTAKMFDNDKLFYPMGQKVDTLYGMHANQHIPQIIGALRIFEATGEARYFDIASYFWDAVTKNHIYAIGGTGEGEMFHQPGLIAEKLSEHTAESCASYNMLKLTKELFMYAPEGRYMDYYERTMVNHILSSGEQKPTGASTYFMPLAPGFHKEFDEENSCCHGTGLENHFKYADCIYFKSGDSLYVNLFINSHVRWEEKGISLIQKISQDGGNEGNGKLHVDLLFSGKAKLKLRIHLPYWCLGEPVFSVNGTGVKAAWEGGYFVLDRDWENGDRVTFAFDCVLRLEPAPDDVEKVVICWGPYVLAALTDSKDYLQLHGKGRPLGDLLIHQGSGVRFCLKGSNIVFIPLCQVEDQAYQVYLQL